MFGAFSMMFPVTITTLVQLARVALSAGGDDPSNPVQVDSVLPADGRRPARRVERICPARRTRQVAEVRRGSLIRTLAPRGEAAVASVRPARPGSS